MDLSDTINDRRGPAWVAGAVAALMLLAVLLRVVGLGASGLWYDELILATLVSDGPGRLVSETVELARPPLFSAMAWAWMVVFGESEAALRSLSVVFGVAAVPVMFAVGRRLMGWRVGLMAAAFLAVGPYQVYYAQEYRYYAAVMCFSLCSVWFGLRGAGVGGERGGAWNWVGYTAFGVAAVYCHVLSLVFFAALFLAGAGLWWRSAIGRREAVHGLVASLIAGVLSMPMVWWLWHAVTHTTSESTGASMSWIERPAWWAPVQSVGNYILLSIHSVRPMWLLSGAAVLALGTAFAWRPREEALGRRPMVRPRRETSDGWWVAGCLAVVPLALAFALSLAVKPVYVDRYYIAASMGWYVLLAGAIVAVHRWLPMWASLSAVLVAMSGSLVSHYTMVQNKGSWRDAGVWLDQHAGPDEAVMFFSERGGESESRKTRENWAWYGRAEHAQGGLDMPGGGQMQDPEQLCQGVSELIAGDGTGWLVVWTAVDRCTPLAEQIDADLSDGVSVIRHEVFNDIELIQVMTTGQAGQDGGRHQPPLGG